MKRWTVSVAALAASAVGLDDLKAHLRVDLADEDALIDALGRAATEAVERASGRLLVQRKATLWCEWPTDRTVAVPYPPVATITAARWVLRDGTTEDATGAALLSGEEGLVDLGGEGPVGTPRDHLALEIVYTAGYTAPPEPLLTAVKVLTGYMFERREGVPVSRIGDALVGGLPPAVHALISPFRSWYGGPESWKRAA